MPNPYRVFKDLLPESPLLIGTVASSSGDVHVVTLIDGGMLTVRGEGTLGQRVFIRDGVIEGTAPSLTAEVIEI